MSRTGGMIAAARVQVREGGWEVDELGEEERDMV
jgi:hypothetical protein